MSKFEKFVRSAKFKSQRDLRKGSFGDQFPKVVPKPVRSSITDAEGIRRAYADGDTHVHGKTLYIAGSHTMQDWFDDFTKNPVLG